MIGDARTRLAVLLSAVVWLAAAARLPAGTCATAPYRQFDFVIGNWLVRDSTARVTATVTVVKKFDGCVLLESWRGAGRTGEALGVIGYTAERGRWQREFLEAGGVVLTLDGVREGTAMVMAGRDYPPEGPRLHRVVWSPRSDGTVEERWQTSTDDGRSWTVHHYGVFSRIAE